jgi:folate-dependent phosphoribosylglycinamide formyltransferase PurN
VSPHFIDDKIDTGAIILSDETEIEPLEKLENYTIVYSWMQTVNKHCN